MEIKSSHSLSKDIQNLLAEAIQVPIGLVTPDLAFGDLPEWDSLGHMEVMMRLEEQFEVEVNTDTIAQLVSIPEIIKYIEGQRNATG